MNNFNRFIHSCIKHILVHTVPAIDALVAAAAAHGHSPPMASAYSTSAALPATVKASLPASTHSLQSKFAEGLEAETEPLVSSMQGSCTAPSSAPGEAQIFAPGLPTKSTHFGTDSTYRVLDDDEDDNMHGAGNTHRSRSGVRTIVGERSPPPTSSSGSGDGDIENEANVGEREELHDVVWLIDSLSCDAPADRKTLALRELKLLTRTASDAYWTSNCAQLISVLLEAFVAIAASETGMSDNCATSSAVESMQFSCKALLLLVRHRSREVAVFIDLLASKLCQRKCSTNFGCYSFHCCQSKWKKCNFYCS